MVNRKYIGSSFDDFLKEELKDPEFRFYYERASAVKNIAYIVRELRKKAKLSQQQVAKRAKTTQTVIARLESGRDERTPSLDLLQRVAFALGVTLKINFESKKAA
jgi:ribosome-binding protein aMBF1 (putative translation factor)